MTKVKIYGAGSIGNHLANASRALGWDVLICDSDPQALQRTKNDIYPARYGAWDPAIRLCTLDQLPDEQFDVVIVGTPPDSHLAIGKQVLESESPRVLLLEKPLCTPSLEGLQDFVDLARAGDTRVLVGYNHTLGSNTLAAQELLAEGFLGQIQTMTCGFQEYWGGIFGAHPWLAGPQDSYLGYWDRGGGASGEHSHAINLWQHFAHFLGQGRITQVYAFLDFVKSDGLDYDRLCHLNVLTETGFSGLILQDVITDPARKSLRIQGSEGYLEWLVDRQPGQDAVLFRQDGQERERLITKTRADDFLMETRQVKTLLEGEVTDSPIALKRGADTMLVIAAAHESFRQKRPMTIDYGSYTSEAITPL
jgi:predicted dehydrogenase